ncbi:MAG TPA: DHA2 family efflux MFS transporter permease subunit [Bryobacteraceae bacterium]|jgi:DHA2 family multidrug resistance protein
MANNVEQQGWHPGHNPWAVALTVTLATFMEVMDISIANVALPHIAGGLSAGIDESTWILTSYLVSNAVVLPISAWLSDRFGRKCFYMTCVALFTASSFLCGIAPTLGMLIVFRVFQGMGGGGLGPSEQAILADTFPPAKRGMAFAVYGMAVVLAPAIGPTLGGWITDQYSWRWIFFVNLPVGVLSLFLISFMVKDPPHLERAKREARRNPVDFVGLVLVATGLAALQVVLDKGQRNDWFGSPFIVWFTVISGCALVTFVFWEWNQKHPIIHLRLFKNSSFTAACLIMLLVFASLLGATLLIPQFAQTVLGYTAQKAGELLSPGGFAILLAMPLVGFLSSRVDARLLIAGGLLIVSGALFRMSHLELNIDYTTLMLWRVYQSVGMAFVFVPVNIIAYTGMPPEASNQVSAMVNLMRNVGGSVGISAVTTLLARRQQIHQVYLARSTFQYNPRLQQLAAEITTRAGRRLSPADAVRQAYGRIYQILQAQALALAYVDVFRILGIVVLLAVILVFFAKKTKPGQAAMGH